MSSRRLLLAIALAGLVCAQTPAARADVLPVVAVRFRGHIVLVKSPATVERAVEAGGARPAFGRLLDIRGGVLRRIAFAPTYSRDGSTVPGDAPVDAADIVDYADGKDRVEPSVVETFASPAGNPGSHIGRVSRSRRGLVSNIVVALPAPHGPFVALTFDDGPDPRWTPAVLDALASAHASATFFVIGRHAAALPDLVRSERDHGMSVEDHTWDHPRLTRYSTSYVRSQLARTRDLIRSLGANPTLFRPPYGAYTPATVSLASGLGLRTALWSVDPRDWSRPGTDAIVGRVMQQVRPGSIVILHDGGRDRTQTVQAVRTLLRDLAERGYVFVSLR